MARNAFGNPVQVLPEHYAHERVALLKSRAQGKFGKALPAMLQVPWDDYPTLRAGFSGVPVDAIIGFTSMASSSLENTTEGVPTQAFHEIGLGQTPAGLRDGPAPNPDASQVHNTWGRVAATPYVRKLIETFEGAPRDAVMGPDEWKGAVVDQAAVMLSDLRGNVAGISRKLGNAGVKDPSSTWAVALAFMGFSSGASPAASYVLPYVTELAQVPERQRWSAFADLIERDVQSGAKSWQIERHYLPSWRKFESGRQLAYAMGRGPAFDRWYDRPHVNSGVWIQRSLDDPSYTPGASPAGGGIAGVAVLAVLVGGVLYYVRTRRRSRRR